MDSFCLNGQKVSLLQFVAKGIGDTTRYIVTELDSWSEKARILAPSQANVEKMEALNLDEDNDKFWLCYVADCAFPPLYLIRAPDEQDALEVFLDKTDIATIPADDMKDYPEDENGERHVHYADCGKICNIESYHSQELLLVAMITEDGQDFVHPGTPKKETTPGAVITGQRLIDPN